MAKITRDQHDPTKNVQKKIFQKGSLLMDADLNEQADIDLERHRRALSCMLIRADARFDDGFKVIPNSTALTVGISMGDAGFHLDANHAVIITHAAPTELTGFADWVAGGVTRTDTIYIDIEEKEISPADDPDIVNPAADAETCRDSRIEYTLRIASDTSSVPSAPADHVYRMVARVTKDGTSNSILTDEIELTLPHINASLESMEIPIWTNAAISNASSDAQDLENSDFAFIVYEEAGGSVTNVVIKVPYVYDPAHNYLALRCQAKRSSWVTQAYARLDGFGVSGTQAHIQLSGASETLEDIVTYLQPPAGLVAGNVYELQVSLFATSTMLTECYMYRPVILAGLARFTHAQGGV